jgi:hypothetical protein
MGRIRKFGCPLVISAAGMLALAAPAPADDDVAVAPAPVPHLSSPTNLPPGTVTDPPPPAGRMDYLRDLWHAVQTQEISGGNALLLLTQMPMDAPAQGLPDSPVPQTPTTPVDAPPVDSVAP